METCSYCGRPNDTTRNMCSRCFKLKQTYNDLAFQIRHGKKLSPERQQLFEDIEKLYEKAEAHGHKRPRANTTPKEERQPKEYSYLIEYCEYCGATNTERHTTHKDMCRECGKIRIRGTSLQYKIKNGVVPKPKSGVVAPIHYERNQKKSNIKPRGDTDVTRQAKYDDILSYYRQQHSKGYKIPAFARKELGL